MSTGGGMTDWLAKMAGPSVIIPAMEKFLDGLKTEKMERENTAHKAAGGQAEFDEKVAAWEAYSKSNKVEDAVRYELYGLQMQG